MLSWGKYTDKSFFAIIFHSVNASVKGLSKTMKVKIKSIQKNTANHL